MISVIPERPVGAWWATGLTTAERRQTAEPEWAGFITRAIAGAAPSEPPDDWRDALAAIFTPLVAVVRARVGQAVGSLPDIHHDRVTDGIARNLGGKLVTLAVRTLVFELNRARVDGTLQGATPEARFIDFTRRTGTIDGLTRLFAEYPVLARLTGQACLHTLDSTVEVLTRFAEDRPAITTAFGHDTLGTLIDVQDNAGDSHARGRSVRILEFSCGRKVVYKPRPLDLHVRFTGVVRWLNGRLPGLELSTVDALLRPGYGWLEFIEHAPCADLDDVDRFYRRQGVLLALLHALDATDVHYENIIAAADQPVLVDVETLLQPPPPGFVADDPASEVLARSVQRTMLLPRLMVGDRGALDVSGLGGRGGQLPNDQVQWADAGTDRMRLTRVAADLPGAFNLPYLDAEGAEES